MNILINLQQEVEKWASLQGISSEEFIVEAIGEKLNRW